MAIAGFTHVWMSTGEAALQALDEYPRAVVVELHPPGEDVCWAITDDALTLAGWLQSGTARVVNCV